MNKPTREQVIGVGIMVFTVIVIFAAFVFVTAEPKAEPDSVQPSQNAMVVEAPRIPMSLVILTCASLVLLAVGVAYKQGILKIERDEEQSDKTEVEQLENLRASLRHSEQQNQRKYESIQRLSEERNQMARKFSELRKMFGLSEDEALIEAIKTLLEAPKEQLSERWQEVTEEELIAFLETVRLDKKAFMSKRRRERLQGRMSAEGVKFMRRSE